MNIMALDDQDRLRIAMTAQAKRDRVQWALAEMIDAQPVNRRVLDERLFIAMWAAGVSRFEIGAHFGVSRTTVSATRNRLGLAHRLQTQEVPCTPLDSFLRGWRGE